MHKHMRRADYVLHCDASDHALATIITVAPSEEDVRAHFYRRLLPHKTTWSSALRELEGYRDALLTLCKKRDMDGAVVEIVGDSLCCHCIFENGGSQVVDEATGTLLITEVLLELLTGAASAGAEVRFRWVQREDVQDADDLSKFVDRMDFGLKPARLSEMWRRLGPWDIDRFACEHHTTCPRFNSLIESRHSEAVDAMAQDWSSGVSFILPNFHMIDQITDKIERDNADVVLIVPAWQHKPWWRRLHSGAWRARLAMTEFIPAQALVAYNEHCFFTGEFTTELYAMRTCKR